MKVLLLTIQILTNYTIERPMDIPTALAYSVSEAQCRLDFTNWAACSMACPLSLNWLGYEVTVSKMPACIDILEELSE